MREGSTRARAGAAGCATSWVCAHRLPSPAACLPCHVPQDHKKTNTWYFKFKAAYYCRPRVPGGIP